MTKLLTLGVLFSTKVKAAVLAKSIILGILSLTSFTLVLKAAVVAKLVILGISPVTSFYLALRVVLVAKFLISGILSLVFYLSIIFSLFNNIIFYYIT